MAHDFVNFPELTKSQMEFYYFESPHKQIFEDFTAEVVKVHDGDTVTLRCNFRDFDFPLRFINIAAPEMRVNKSPNGPGEAAQSWLENKILGEEVQIHINPNNRVEKWGRLLGYVIFRGMDIGEEEVNSGFAVPWANRLDNVLPDFEKMIKVSTWF
jgi:endonuclease YncB( thermonuclease family)